MNGKQFRPLLGALALFALVPMPVLAQDAVTWVRDVLYYPTNVVVLSPWSAPTGEVFATDPLTLWGTEGDPIAVPRTPAEAIGLTWITGEQRGGALMLVWSNEPVVCGEEYVGVIGVDTGLAAFMTPADVAALHRYGLSYDGNLYAGPLADQIDSLYPGPFLTDLPRDLRFPISGSGWGDGGYPVSSLFDAQGNMVALYAQFITAEGRDWGLPPPCADAAS